MVMQNKGTPWIQPWCQKYATPMVEFTFLEIFWRAIRFHCYILLLPNCLFVYIHKGQKSYQQWTYDSSTVTLALTLSLILTLTLTLTNILISISISAYQLNNNSNLLLAAVGSSFLGDATDSVKLCSTSPYSLPTTTLYSPSSSAFTSSISKVATWLLLVKMYLSASLICFFPLNHLASGLGLPSYLHLKVAVAPGFKLQSCGASTIFPGAFEKETEMRIALNMQNRIIQSVWNIFYQGLS